MTYSLPDFLGHAETDSQRRQRQRRKASKRRGDRSRPYVKRMD